MKKWVTAVALVSLLGVTHGWAQPADMATDKTDGLSLAAGAQPPEMERGAVVLKLDFDATSMLDQWSRAAEAKWTQEGPDGKSCLLVDAAGKQPGSRMVRMPIDLVPFRGMQLFFECRARAEGVTKPAQAYNGVKFMLHYKTASVENWFNQYDLFGSFDWKTIGFSATIPEDAGTGDLCLGLEDSAGKVWFGEITATVQRPRPPKRPAPDRNAPPAFKGHKQPRLRGVMSPNQFKDEDLRVLGLEWKANLIRWQLTRDWGKAGTDRDLDEYDKWLDGKLDELQKVVSACKKYGLKVVIDMHSPPGGRYEDSSVALLYEKKYQDHFVKSWEKIARHFKGNPALWAYDLINEPVSRKPTPRGMDYLETQVRAARAIRAIDPDTTILIESENGDGPEAFAWLTPVDVSNVVYQVHMYVPHSYTHQGVSGTQVGILYPGKIDNHDYDKAALRKILEPVRTFQLAYNAHIFVGEFSAIRWAPGAVDYLRDCIELFEEYDWDWTYHAYREWDGWSVEHGNNQSDHQMKKEATDRKKLLLDWFGRNIQ